MSIRYLLAFLLLTTAALADGPPSSSSTLGVERLMANVTGHKGALRVRGLVGKTVPEKHLFSLVDLSDREEVLRTGKTQCVTLPVHWTKEMPALHAVVLVDGEVEEIDGRLVLVATAVTPDDPPTGGTSPAGGPPQ